MYLVWLIILIIAVITVPSLFKEREFRDLAVFGVLWVISTLYASFIALGAHVPKPTDLIVFIFAKLFP